MNQSASQIQAEDSAAICRVEAFQQRFGDGHVYLAYHAALPLALTSDLLYRLWASFQRDGQGELLEIPWIAVSDLLLSNLCQEVGEELYEMEDRVREVLLQKLRSQSQLGETRLREVAEFVLAYVEPQLNHPDLDARDMAEMQQWRSLAYVEPEVAARAIALRLAELDHGNKLEWLRMCRLVEPLAEPLVEFGALVDYTRGMAAFVRGQREEAISQLRRALREKREVKVAGVRLPFPEAVRSTLLSDIQTVGVETTEKAKTIKKFNWTKWGFLIGTPIALYGAVATLVVVPEIRCRLGWQSEICPGHDKDVSLVVQSEDGRSIADVKVRVLSVGAPKLYYTDSNGYAMVKITNKGSVWLSLEKPGYPVLNFTINLANDQNTVRVIKLSKQMGDPKVQSPNIIDVSPEPSAIPESSAIPDVPPEPSVISPAP